MYLLGIDYGKKRIGLATGDSTTGMAFPLKTIDGSDEAAAITEILKHAKAEGVERLVVGVPKPLAKADGVVRKNVEKEAKAFAEALRARTDLAVDAEDERFSSRLADRWRVLSGTKKKNFDRDAAAAAAILESYITRKFGKG